MNHLVLTMSRLFSSVTEVWEALSISCNAESEEDVTEALDYYRDLFK